MRDHSKKDLYSLIIDLENVNRNLDRIKTDPDYISKKAESIFGNKKRDHSQEIKAILDSFL